jgi:mono/diheme cytochrome c family protein
MNRFVFASFILVALVAYALTAVFEGRAQEGRSQERRSQDRPATANGARPQAPGPEQDALQMIKEGRQIFRHDTFGDEEFWGGALQLHRAIAGERLGGVGPGVSPKTALEVGLKVDAEALPQSLVQQIERKQVDLEDPATTIALLKLDAVVGVKGFVEKDNTLRSVGITCAICHSTVDDSFSKGIGKRLDGWPNRDLNVGKIITLAPNLKPFTDRLGISEKVLKDALLAWGPGKYDAELVHDGKAFRPDGKTAATLLPAAFGLAGVNNHTYTGWGSVTHWNAYVANTQMQGKGTFFDPRLRDQRQFPVAAKMNDWNIRNDPDLVTSKLPALHFYQLSIPAPKPPDGSYDRVAAARGQSIFNGKANCARCHVPPLFTEPGWPMHTGEEIGIDDFQAERSPDRRYRTTPLRGLWAHSKGGFYHDGRFATLGDVIDHYNAHFRLGLSERESEDLAEYLKSL